MLIALDHVTKFYEVAGEKNAVLKNVSLVISEGDFVTRKKNFPSYER